MAHIEIPLENDRHITIVHLGDAKQKDVEVIIKQMELWKNHFEWSKPVLSLDKRKRFGRQNNIPVMTVKSTFVNEARQRCVDLLEMLNIKYTKDWKYEPHVTNPPDGWLYKGVLEFTPQLDLHYRDKEGQKLIKTFLMRRHDK